MIVNVVHDIDELPAGLRFVLAIGRFDGIHRGHARVVGALRRSARRFDAVPVVLTFDPHPAQVLRGRPPALLCDVDERLELLEQLGLGITIVQPFT